MILVKIG